MEVVEGGFYQNSRFSNVPLQIQGNNSAFSVVDILRSTAIQDGHQQLGNAATGYKYRAEKLRLEPHQDWTPPVVSRDILPSKRAHPAEKSPPRAKMRRIRTIFTRDQLEVLEKIFEDQQYMVGSERIRLAHQLGLTETQVKVWFQNRRIKWRRQEHDDILQKLQVPSAQGEGEKP